MDEEVGAQNQAAAVGDGEDAVKTKTAHDEKSCCGVEPCALRRAMKVTAAIILLVAAISGLTIALVLHNKSFEPTQLASSATSAHDEEEVPFDGNEDCAPLQGYTGSCAPAYSPSGIDETCVVPAASETCYDVCTKGYTLRNICRRIQSTCVSARAWNGQCGDYMTISETDIGCGASSAYAVCECARKAYRLPSCSVAGDPDSDRPRQPTTPDTTRTSTPVESDTPRSGSTSTTTTKGVKCFPADGIVEHIDGTFKRMDKLVVGDSIRVPDGTFSPVWWFGHRDRGAEKLEYIRLKTTSGHSLELSDDHILLANGDYSRAEDVNVGDMVYVWHFQNGTRAATHVQSKSTVLKAGRFAPVTLHGQLLVNGVAASSYVAEFKSAHARTNAAIIDLVCSPFRQAFTLHPAWFKAFDTEVATTVPEVAIKRILDSGILSIAHTAILAFDFESAASIMGACLAFAIVFVSLGVLSLCVCAPYALLAGAALFAAFHKPLVANTK